MNISIAYTKDGFDLTIPEGPDCPVAIRLEGPGTRSYEMLGTAAAGVSGHREASFKWPSLDFPVRSIRASLLQDDVQTSGSNSVRWSEVAKNLFPATDDEYKYAFARKVERPGTAFADYFVADQIGRFFKGSTYYRCGAAVVKGYKAVEVGDGQYLESAETWLRKALVDVEDCEVHWHPRQNGEHLEASLLCCLWHVQLARADQDGFRSTLSKLEALAGRLSNYFTPSYPINLSLLASAALSWLNREQGRLDYLAELAISVFKRGVAESDPSKQTLFAELRIPHMATVQMLSLRGSASLHADTFKSIFQRSLRVSGPPVDRLHANLLVMAPDG